MRFGVSAFIALTLLSPAFSHAQVSINEVMYDVSGSDSDREWVEIYNSGAVGVDVSTWKFLEKVGASNHGLTLIQGSEIIPANGYAVIVLDSVKFLLDNPSYTGTIFRSAFSSLNNTGATVSLKDGESNVVDSVTYSSSMGASGDGSSLQKNGISWISATPTPGLVNSSVSVSTTTDGGTDNTATTTEESSTGTTVVTTSSSAHSSTASLSGAPLKMEFEISAGRDRLVMTGSKALFRATATKLQNVSEQVIEYRWSFGDGTSASGREVSHAYKFPGEYAVVLNASASDKQAVSRIVVRVVSPKVTISVVPGGVEVLNNGKDEVNLESWALASPDKTFVFPKDTIVMPGKRVIFANEIIGFISDEVSLLDPSGQEFTSFKPESVLTLQDTTETMESEALALQAKINMLQSELATALTTTLPKSANPTPALRITPEAKSVDLGEAPLLEEEVELPQVASVVQVFEANPKPGAISRVFAWPIKSLNFLRGLFREE